MNHERLYKETHGSLDLGKKFTSLSTGEGDISEGSKSSTDGGCWEIAEVVTTHTLHKLTHLGNLAAVNGSWIAEC